MSHILDKANDYPLLSKEEEEELVIKMQAGDKDARDRVMGSCLRLVVKIANHYNTCGIPTEDLIQEGCIGLATAADHYELGMGARFATYAAYWVRQSITRAIPNQSHALRLPVGAYVRNRRVIAARDELHAMGEDISAEAIAEYLGDISANQAHDALIAIENMSATSLDAIVRKSDGYSPTQVGDFIENETVETAEDALNRNLLSESLKVALRELTPREADVIVSRFGLNGNDEETLDTIGARYGVTRERVRQIEKEALSKMRCSQSANALHDLLYA